MRDHAESWHPEAQAGADRLPTPLHLNQPDYSANMPAYGSGAILSRTAHAAIEEWLEADEDERRAIDRRVERRNAAFEEMRIENLRREALSNW